MTNNSLKAQKDNQLKALRKLFWLAILGFASLLIIQAISLSRTQLAYQQALMKSVSQSVLKELTQFIATQRLQMALFQNDHHAIIQQQFENPDKTSEDDFVRLMKDITTDFPSSRLYTIISSDGTNLLQHITGTFLQDCQEEVNETVQSGQQNRLFLHRSKTSTHYDLIIPKDAVDRNKGYFFIAFNINFITDLLGKYQLPYQQLFLLRNDKAGFIEVSTELESHLISTQLFAQQELKEFEYSLRIPDTRWSFAIRLNPETKYQIVYIALWQSLITWSLITLLLYLAYRLIKRNQELKYLSQLQLNQSKQRAETLINSVNEAVFSIDCEHKITFANTRAKALISMRSDEIVGKNFSDVCNLYNVQENQEQHFSDIIHAYKQNRLPDYSNLTLKNVNSEEISVAVKLAPIYGQDTAIEGYAITIEDLSAAIILSKRLVFNESRDKLTGLFNRRMLEKNLNIILSEIKLSKPKTDSAIILIDLDKFKIMNTSHGFEAGDEYLKRIAIQLRSAIPADDFLSRLSSDEFVVVIKNTNDLALKEICDNIKSSIRNYEFRWKDDVISTSVCLGVVKLDEHFLTIDEVLSAADHACRLAKSKGSNITQYYQTDDPEIKQRAEEITRIVDLRKALDSNNFMLYRQAIRSTSLSETNQEKYELLIRMKGEDGNIIPPIHFIHIAEKYGFMTKIDRWVIYNTFKHLAFLADKDTAKYNLNVSSKTVGDKGIISFVEALFDEFSVDPTRINFEITETSAISYLDNALDFMQAMKARGCTFSLDDFGTGLASFDYLRKLPIDYLKIDGVFVKDIQTNPNDFAFVEAIHNISHQMNIKTVAEFVENESIFKILQEIGVDYAQGYYLHKPELWYDG